MLLIPAAGLVILENPKTASQSLRAMLRADADSKFSRIGRHIGFGVYQRHHAARAQAICGALPLTVAVVRAPLARLESWFRYRSREKARGTAWSTDGVTFPAFLEAVVAPDAPAFARFGRQARFTGWTGQTAEVDHLFDYARLDLLVGFLSVALGRPLTLPRRNVSPAPTGPLWEDVPPDLAERVAAAFAADLALHAAVSAAGHWRRAPETPAG